VQASQILIKQQLTSSDRVPDRRGGGLMRSFRRVKSTDRKGNNDHSASIEVTPYDLIVQRSADVRRPVVVMGLFCDVVRDMLVKDSPGIYEVLNENIISLLVCNLCLWFML